MSNSVFNFPQIHSFPPFYTRQLHEETWQKQKDLWIEMILGFCGFKRIFEIDLMDDFTYQMPIFFNTKIDRKIDKEFLQELITEMVKNQKAAWLNPLKKSCAFIFWHRPAEWAQFVYKFVERIGGIGSIFTVYDLIEGDDSINEEFHGLPDNFMKLVITELEKSGKARLFSDDTTGSTSNTSNSFKESGLKFF